MIPTTTEGAVLALHIAAGFVALAGGAGALLTRKGGLRHRRFGRGYVYSMAVVAGSALVLYALTPSGTRLFLAMVAVFSYYFVFSGYRTLSRKRPGDAPGRADWAATGLLVLSGVGLLAMGARLALDGDGFATVMVAFGGIGTVFGLLDARGFRRGTTEAGAWLVDHLVRMCAGYVATVTAFATVNFTFLPVVARWLLPTLVGGPAIYLLARKYDPGSSSGSGEAAA